MFTRKHYVQIAEVIASIESTEQRNAMAKKHADQFAQDNPRFDRARFFAACGVK